MRLIDRFLVVRRAVLIALNPNCDAVVITRMGKGGELYKNCIWSVKKIGTSAYLKYLQRMFLDNAKSGDSLHTTALTFLHGVQGQWNEKHPDDQVSMVVEVEK